MKVTLARVVHAEFTKVRALRSTWIVLGATALLVVGFAGAAGWAQHRDVVRGGPAPSTAQAVGGALLGVDLLSLVVGVFGVLLMTGEYGSGLIRATFAAVPRRLPVLWAKAVVLLAVALPVLVVACLAALLTGGAFLGADAASLGDPGVARAVVGAGCASAGMGLIGLGVGALLRHTAAAITTLVAATLVVPALLPLLLPDSVRDSVTPYAPAAALQAMYAVDASSNPFKMLSPGGGAAVVVAYAAVLLAGAAMLLRRRDA